MAIERQFGTFVLTKPASDAYVESHAWGKRSLTIHKGAELLRPPAEHPRHKFAGSDFIRASGLATGTVYPIIPAARTPRFRDFRIGGRESGRTWPRADGMTNLAAREQRPPVKP